MKTTINPIVARTQRDAAEMASRTTDELTALLKHYGNNPCATEREQERFGAVETELHNRMEKVRKLVEGI